MMRKNILIVFLVFMLGNVLFAQSNYTLIGERNAKNISLLWSVDKWDNNLEGVYVKRRSILKNGQTSDWKLLTTELLVPYNQVNKSLSNVSNSKTIVRELVSKRAALIQNTVSSTTKITEISAGDFKKELLQDPTVQKMLGLMFIFDYDIALMYGFGYVDVKFPKKEIVEYGLFPVTNGIESTAPAAVFQWNAEKLANLNVKVVKEKIKRKGKKIQLRLEYNGEELDSMKTLAGFNVYRKVNSEDFSRINSKVIWLSKATKKRVLNFGDKIEDENQQYTYAITPVSVFKNEGAASELTWNKADEVILQAPELYTKQHPNIDFIKEGVKLQWKFEDNHEKEVRGFIVQRKAGSETQFITISDTLMADVRTYTDNSLQDSDIKNFYYRVIVKPKESFGIWSNVLRLFYNPKPIVKEMKELTATPRIENDQAFVQLNWQAENDFINQIHGFLVYCDRSGGILAKESDIPVFKDTSYEYRIEGGAGRNYQFTIKYENLDGSSGNYTDTIDVVIPSKKLPFITVWPFTIEEKNLIFQWKYPNNIMDLKGFRIYLNNQLVEDENQVNKSQRSWTLENLEPGTYELEMQAVSESEVISKRSQKRIIEVN
ncbi:hypothetical protein DMA11_11945 [Marinilabiliaceae bacterium JC017]|nr:hypothetical protein DMA11_11945 [Marinilabiliaceae bacterium JC017]